MDTTTTEILAILAKREKLKEEADALRAEGAERITRANHIDALVAAAEALARSVPSMPGKGAVALFGADEVERRAAPSAAPASNNGKMSTPDAVIAVMMTAPKRSWKAADVLAEMEKRGWLVTEAKNPGHKVLTTMG